MLQRREPRMAALWYASVAHHLHREIANLAKLLTGATGGLGAHILDTLRRDNKTMRIICLVRATDNDTARRRVSESLTLRKKQALTDDSDRRVWCMPVHFDKPDLGLPTEVLEHIQKETTHIIHVRPAYLHQRTITDTKTGSMGSQFLPLPQILRQRARRRSAPPPCSRTLLSELRQLHLLLQHSQRSQPGQISPITRGNLNHTTQQRSIGLLEK